MPGYTDWTDTRFNAFPAKQPSAVDDLGANDFLFFDGVDDEVTIVDDNDFSFGDGSDDTAFSIAVDAVKSGAESGSRVLFSKWTAVGSNFREYQLFFNAATDMRFSLYDESLNQTQTRLTDAEPADGRATWVGTYDGRGGGSAMNGGIMYRDGVVLASSLNSTNTYDSMENTSAIPRIGAMGGNSDEPINVYDEAIYRVKIFSRVLTLAESADPWSVTDNVVAFWKIDEGSGTTVADSEAGHTGTIIGAVWNGP